MATPDIKQTASTTAAQAQEARAKILDAKVQAENQAKKVKDAKKSKHEKGETKAQEKKEHTSGKEKKEKKESKPKSTGKLVDLKKEKEALKAMQEALGKYMVNEGENETQLEAAFAEA